MTGLTFFTVEGDFLGIVGDGTSSLRGRVTFTPEISSGDVILATNLTPRPASLLLEPVSGAIRSNGQLKSGDDVGVRLVANTAVLNLTGPLTYHVSFKDVFVGTERIGIKDFSFTAPTSDTTINLVTVGRVPGTTGAGIVRGPGVDDVQLDDTNLIFKVQGTTVGDVDISGFVFNGDMDNITDATVVGKAVARAADQAAARTAIGATSAADITAAVNGLLNGAPGALDTLKELATALGDDANFAATVTSALAGKQPSAANLTALAGLTSAANKVPYFTASGTAAVTDLTAAGRALLDDADAAAQRTTLGATTVGANMFTAADDIGARAAINAHGATKARKVITVGPGGTYSTLNAAIQEASRYASEYQFSASRLYNPFVEIRQKSGFVMAEQVFIVAQDLSYIAITSEDPVVTITRSALTTNYGGSDQNWRSSTYPAFCAARGAKLPCIKTLYSMDSSGTGAGTIGVCIFENSMGVIFIGCGVKNAGWRGLYVDGSVCYARGTVWDGAGYATGPEGTLAGIRVSNGAVVQAREASAKNCATGIYVTAAWASVIAADFTGAGSLAPSTAEGYGIGASTGAIVMGGNTKVDNATKRGVYVANGSQVYLGADSAGVYSSATGCGVNAAYVEDGGTFIAPFLAASSVAGHAIQVSASRVQVAAATITSAAGRGISAADGSHVNAQVSTITGTADWGVRLFTSSQFDATGAKIGGTSGGVQLNSGSVLHKNGATALDGTTALNTNVPTGQITANGLMLGVDAVKTILFNTSGTLTADALHIYAGSTARTPLLPLISASAGKQILVKNASTAMVTVTRTGSDPIYFNSVTATTTLDVPPGGACTLWCDGAEWVVTSFLSAAPVLTARDLNAQTGTAYTLVALDAGKNVTLNNAAAITLTVPTNASVAFPIGTYIDLAQLGAGQVTVAGTGVTINATPGLKISAQYGAARLRKYATDTWLLTGNLTA